MSAAPEDGRGAADVDLSIVIASHGTAGLLAACLASIEQARDASPAIELETIVVDNASPDDSVACARSSCLAPRVLAYARNRGFAAAVNAGVAFARGRYVLLLNSDVEVPLRLLADAVALLDEELRIGVLGPALVHPDGRPQRSVHVLPGLDSELLGEGMARRLRRRERDHAGPPVAWRDVEAVRGAVFFVRKELFEKVGSLDEGFFFFLEETDFCARVRGAGHAVAWVPGWRVPHRLGASSKRRAPLATRIEYLRSLDRALRQHRGPTVARAVALVRFLRAVAGLVVAALPSLFSVAARARNAERLGLVLWHLRGRPPEPSLADALASASSDEDAARS